MAHRKRRRIQRACILSGLSLINLSITIMLAQSTAQISGTLRDQTGAVLPGVEVTATQSDTGFKRSAVTDETGLTYFQVFRWDRTDWMRLYRVSAPMCRPASSCR